MRLSELLENEFRGDVRFRGAAYLKAERVAITRVTADEVFAVVRDGTEYQTQLSRQESDLKMYCNCAAGNQPGATCKHLWATILYAEEEGYLSGSMKPGYIPPFTLQAETSPLDRETWEDTLRGDVYHPPTSIGDETDSVVNHLRPWESKLQELRQRMSTGGRAASTTTRAREIFYEIDLAESKSVGQLIVQTSQRQRRANGQWGKLKPFKLRPDNIDEIEREDDARILAYLSGGTPDRSNWYAQQAEVLSAVYRYRLPFALCELILPLMCGTGRVRCQGGGSHRNATLEWDDGPPWELSMNVVFDADDGMWRLEGVLQRDGEEFPVNDAELLLPGGLVVTQSSIARLEDFEAFGWVDLLLQSEPLTAPATEEHELVEQLLDMPALPRLELPDDLQLERVECEPTPLITLRSPSRDRWRQDRLFGEVAFDYLGTSLPASSTRWAIVQRQQQRCLLRNREREAEAWSRLTELGFRRLVDQRRGTHDVEIAAGDLGDAVRHLIAEGWQVLADEKPVRRPAEVQLRVSSGIDWFELRADVDFEGFSIPFPELLSAISRGDSTVRFDDGSLGILPEDWPAQFNLLSGLGVLDGDHVRFSHSQVALLDALLAAQPSVEYDQKFDELRKKFRAFEGVGTTKEPTGFHGTLRDYQRDGLGWLHFLSDFQFGGCLADDMGLGKTVQLLAFILDRDRSGEAKGPTLIVVPKSLLFNWQQECERFTPELKTIEYAGLDRERLRDQFEKHEIVLTTYGTLRRDIIELKDIPFDYVVLDEAQTIKNAGSQVAKAARLLRAEHRIALSGTPIENHLSDLWSIFEFLNPGMLGRSSLFKQHTADIENDDTRKLLARGLQPFILRRTKEQVAGELPERTEQTILCDMGDKQDRLYQELRDHYRSSLFGLVDQQGLRKSKMHVLEALLRLRQAACHPGLLNRELQEEPSAKLDFLCPHLEEIVAEGHKALVFSQFTSMLAIVKTHLDRQRINYEYLDGKTRNRQAPVERFQTDAECGVFLISLKAGGLGLNLTAADYVFLLDPWWNPAVEAQAIDRAHRVGQTRQVFAYRLICRNTVEQKIAELQNKKRRLAKAILEADGSLLKELSTEDLELLLS